VCKKREIVELPFVKQAAKKPNSRSITALGPSSALVRPQIS